MTRSVSTEHYDVTVKLTFDLLHRKCHHFIILEPRTCWNLTLTFTVKVWVWGDEWTACPHKDTSDPWSVHNQWGRESLSVCVCVCYYCNHPAKDSPVTHTHTHTHTQTHFLQDNKSEWLVGVEGGRGQGWREKEGREEEKEGEKRCRTEG